MPVEHAYIPSVGEFARHLPVENTGDEWYLMNGKLYDYLEEKKPFEYRLAIYSEIEFYEWPPSPVAQILHHAVLRRVPFITPMQDPPEARWAWRLDGADIVDGKLEQVRSVVCL